MTTSPPVVAQSAPPTRDRRILGAMAAGLFAGVVALLGSWVPSLWSDEAATISGSGRSVGELWRLVGTLDLVHGSYYLLMHFWTSAFGTGTIALRLPSVLAVALAGACVYLIGRRLGGTALAVAASFVFGILPRVTWAGIEGRSFALTALLSAAATLVLLVALESRKALPWAGYGVLLVLGTLSNLFALLLVGGHLVSLLVRRTDRQAWLRWSVTVGLAVVALSVFLLRAASQSGQLGERTFGVVDLARNAVVTQWFLGDTPTTTTGVSVGEFSLRDPLSWWPPASIVLAAVCWILILLAVTAGVRSGQLRSAARTEPSAGTAAVVVWTVPWMVVPTAVIGLYSLVGTPMYSPRYLTFAAPAVALIVGAGILTVARRRLQVVIGTVLFLAVLPIYLSQRQPAAKNGSDWNAVAAFVGTSSRPGDGVYFAPRYDVPGDVVGATTRGIAVAYPTPFRPLVDVTAVQTPAEAGNLTGTSARLTARGAELSGLPTLWVVQRRDYPSEDARADAAFLVAAGFRETSRWTGTLDVVIRFDRN